LYLANKYGENCCVAIIGALINIDARSYDMIRKQKAFVFTN